MPAAAPDSLPGRWGEVVRRLGREKGSKYNLGALLRDCRPDSVHLSDDNATLVLPFSNAANLDRMQEELNDPRVRDTIEQAIEQCFGERHPFTVTLAGAVGAGARPTRNSVQDSPLYRTAIGLGARPIEEN